MSIRIFSSLFIIFLFKLFGLSQTDSTTKQLKPVSVEISAFLESYYGFDFNQPGASKRLDFLYNHTRQNEVNLNLAKIKLALSHEKYRVNLALHAGTYVQDNYANEQIGLRFISEANIGVSLNNKNTLWIDAGILPSYIGFENAVSSENLTLSRSILAENSPYFMSGIMLNYSPKKNWKMGVNLNNGWQRIQRVKGNSFPHFGTQLNYINPRKTAEWNWSTFVGTDDSDQNRRMRYFSNLYWKSTWKKTSLILGFDFGVQQRFKYSKSYHSWFSPVAILKRTIQEKLSLAARAEFYADPSNVLINSTHFSNFKVSAFSMNMDYQILAPISFRLEARYMYSLSPSFRRENLPVFDNFCLLGALSFQFAHTWKEKVSTF